MSLLDQLPPGVTMTCQGHLVITASLDTARAVVELLDQQGYRYTSYEYKRPDLFIFNYSGPESSSLSVYYFILNEDWIPRWEVLERSTGQRSFGNLYPTSEHAEAVAAIDELDIRPTLHF